MTARRVLTAAAVVMVAGPWVSVLVRDSPNSPADTRTPPGS